MNFKENLLEYLTKEETDSLINALDQESLHAVLLNTTKMSDEMFLSLFPEVKKHPIVPHAYIYDKKQYELGKSLYYDLGCFYLQEPSAMVVSHLLQPKPGDIVLDMCAAPGGKSIQASMLMQDQGVIISNDLSSSRVGAIRENAERMGLGNLLIVNNDFSLIYKDYLNYFDKVILDAPCSGSGMFRKMDAMRDDWSYAKVLKNQEIQLSLIEIGYLMLKPGGTMVYSTCSFSKEEDEDVVQYLIDNYDVELLPINNPLFYQYSKQPIGVHTLPSMFPGEGHYICLIKKPGNLEPNKMINIKVNQQYLKLINCDFSHNDIKKYGDYLFSLPFEVKNKKLNVVRYGLKIGEVSGNVLKYDYHFAHYLKSFNNICDLSLEETKLYFTGNSFDKEANNGFILLKYNNANIDIAKCVNGTIKNRLPKGLRHNF